VKSVDSSQPDFSHAFVDAAIQCSGALDKVLNRMPWWQPFVFSYLRSIYGRHHPLNHLANETSRIRTSVKLRQKAATNLSQFVAFCHRTFAAFSRRLLLHGRLTPWLNQGFLSTRRPRSGQRVERC